MRIIGWIIIVFFLCCPNSFAASKAREVKQGKKLFEQGKYEQALEKFSLALEKDPNSDIINFDTGVAAYKIQDFGKAIRHLSQALLTDDNTLKQKTHYNLGNSFYKQGMIKAAQDLPQAVAFLKRSVDHFDRALAMSKKDEDARFNRELAAKELKSLEEELEKQKKAQQQQKQEKNDQTCPFPQKEEGQRQDQNRQETAQEKKDDTDKPQEQDQEQASAQGQEAKEDKDSGDEQKDAGEQASGEEKKEAEKKETENKEEGTESQPSQVQGQPSSQENEEGRTGPEGEPAGESAEEREAMILLEKYQQEEPQGFLQRLLRRQGGERDVEKDW